MTRVLIVDDSVTVRTLFESIIEGSDVYSLAGTLENAKAALPFCMRSPVDLILMDVYTKDRENGLEAAREIKKEFPDIKIIISTSLPEESFLEKAKAAGCESFWYKEVGELGLLDVMNRTMRGESVYPDTTPTVSVGLAKSVEFTPMEMKVLRELCNGKLNKDIAKELCMSENTVKFHINNMLQKAGYSNRYQLAIDAVEQKLIVPGF
ncbi:MAG: response regulator transcription factor [Lachnospiraceae bacterium]|nr:response regulator transcription factor [Lachnospiraceae bacterium]MBR5992854.1 response regulator transcription factor [Lachnospiraceae bacterium]MCR4678215.1 response regulator transcription factor [Lachnospiraceae bacterium]